MSARRMGRAAQTSGATMCIGQLTERVIEH